jgi:hypothetical protein
MLQFEQWENMKFCQKLGKSASKIFQTIKQAYSEEALGCGAVFKWHKRFAQGRDSLEDDEHTSRTRTVRTELGLQEIATLMRANRSQTVDEIAAAAAAGISHGTCHKILSDDLNMSHVTQHSVPPVLTQDQRDNRKSICGDLIESADKDWTFFNQIITRQNMVFSVQPATEATIGCLKIAVIAKKEETATGQVKRQGKA